MLSFRIRTCCVICVVCAGGCEADRGYVQREWSKSLRELGIVPVFPPREDVCVGDVYAYRYDPESASVRDVFESRWQDLTPSEQQQRLEIGMSPRLAQLPGINPQILAEYKERLSAPSTPADYNSILGSPALAAASDRVTAAEEKLKQLRDKVAAAKKSAAEAQAALLTRTREKDDADTAVAQAEKKLTAAKAAPIDAHAEEQALRDAKLKLRDADDRLLKAQRDLADAGDDPAKKAAATLAVKTAEREKADADLSVRRAQEDLDAKKTEKVDVAEAEKELADAKSTQQLKAKELTSAQRKTDDEEAKAKAEEEGQTGPIEDATKAVEGAKALRTAIAEAGVKLLYSQPRDGKLDVFTVDKLTNPQGGADDLANTRINRLRLVGFPEFATTSFTQGDLSALIPIEALSLGINISNTNVSKVSVKVPAAESYALSLQAALGSLGTAQRSLQGNITQWTPSPNFEALIPAALFQTNQNEIAGDKVYFRVITEVFYARALDVSVFSANAFGTRAQVAAPTVPIGAQTTGAQSSGVPAMTPAPINSSAAGTPSATDALTSLQARLATTQTVPGGSVQLVSYNEMSIGLRRVFDRPIAIGIRGLTLEYDVKRKTISRITVGASPIPAALN